MKSSPRDKPRGHRARYAAKDIYHPRGIPTVESRKQKFDRMLAYVQSRGDAWVISVPGNVEVRIECLAHSLVPGELRDAGYHLVDAGEGERIIPGNIVERLELSSSGAFVAATENSTKPIHLRHHSGICKVRRYSFAIS
jgi:hypothetical protein